MRAHAGGAEYFVAGIALMRASMARAIFVSLALLLAGCESISNNSELAARGKAGTETTGSIVAAARVLNGVEDPNDDLNLGKRHFRDENYGLAEKYFRRAVEKGPTDAHRDTEAWLGLAASYDRLRRFELADRAYDAAIKIAGPTAEILNNQGYSYMLRGDFQRARAKLVAAREKEPDNPYIQNNFELLEASVQRRKVAR
jgi:Flp pilus assembly protein TadD